MKKGLGLVTKLKELIPQQLFEVRIQAQADGRIISSAPGQASGKECHGQVLWRRHQPQA